MGCERRLTAARFPSSRISASPPSSEPYVHLACALAGAALFHAASDWQAGKEAAIAGLLAKKGMRPSPKFE